jgi:hypothetical protein
LTQEHNTTWPVFHSFWHAPKEALNATSSRKTLDDEDTIQRTNTSWTITIRRNLSRELCDLDINLRISLALANIATDWWHEAQERDFDHEGAKRRTSTLWFGVEDAMIER